MGWRDWRFRASATWALRLRLRAECSVKLGSPTSAAFALGGVVERAQVAEWLMAADCKSAAPCELRRFESSPVHQVIWMKRLWVALGVYAVLAVLAWTTISEQKFKLATLAILVMFAVRTWSWSKKQQREHHERHDED
jgi:hypothetical protein